MLRVDHLVRGKRPARTAAQAPEEVRKLLANNLVAYGLMPNAILRQVILVEEVAKRTVPHIVEQGTHPQHLFQVWQGGTRWLHGAQGRIELPGKPSSHMHGPQGM